jgi:hypothetical protein
MSKQQFYYKGIKSFGKINRIENTMQRQFIIQGKKHTMENFKNLRSLHGPIA